MRARQLKEGHMARIPARTCSTFRSTAVHRGRRRRKKTSRRVPFSLPHLVRRWRVTCTRRHEGVEVLRAGLLDLHIGPSPLCFPRGGAACVDPASVAKCRDRLWRLRGAARRNPPHACSQLDPHMLASAPSASPAHSTIESKFLAATRPRVAFSRPCLFPYPLLPRQEAQVRAPQGAADTMATACGCPWRWSAAGRCSGGGGGAAAHCLHPTSAPSPPPPAAAFVHPSLSFLTHIKPAD